MSTRRWPSYVFDEGDEPDYRFSLANERTFLAWIRTSLAMLAGSVALTSLNLDVSRGLEKSLAVILATISIGCAVFGGVRWARIERAMRRDHPLPSAGPALLVGVVLLVSACVLRLWR